ncbi:hypothetical protein DPX16_23464 [Anabarilius grahami]|uniref:LINE-1 type transposase domain-containing protein 1 n=1 Tax=Anabarilius grahami TaxID=495550 RepID=A0A3N0XD24_ANAGA|nr:hypothetical protein DPX16_23464 [Anabarilius grahami]
MSVPKSAKNKPLQDETASKKKCKDGPTEDPPNPAILKALQEQEERFAKKVKLAVREVMEELISGEIQTLKNMIESSNSAVNELRQDITRQTELGKTLQARMDTMNANIRVVKQDVNTHQQEILNLRDKLVEMEDRSRRCNEDPFSSSVRRQFADKGLRPFLIYPAILKVKFNGSLHHFNNAEDAGKFLLALDHSSLSTASVPSTSNASSFPSAFDYQENPSVVTSESS